MRCAFILSILLAGSLATLNGYAQQADSVRRNTIYFESGGNGGLASLNYERLVWNDRLALRAGFLYFRVFGIDSRSVPVTASMLFDIPHTSFAVEVGGGANISNFFDRPVVPTGLLALRHQSSSGFFFRIGLAPTADLSLYHPGLALGYSFTDQQATGSD